MEEQKEPDMKAIVSETPKSSRKPIKYIVMSIFILLPFVGFYLGMEYQDQDSPTENNSKVENQLVEKEQSNADTEVANNTSTFQISPIAQKIRISSSSEIPVAMIITDPDNNSYGPDGEGAVAYEQHETGETYDISNPVPGEWSVEYVSIDGIPYSGEEVTVAVITTEAIDYYLPPVSGLDESTFEGIVNEPIDFYALGSFAPSSTIDTYEWDYNSDGIYDEVTTTPVVSYTYSEPYYGLLTLRITDGQGNTDMTTAWVVVKENSVSTSVIETQ